jgi:hypothetical protein
VIEGSTARMAVHESGKTVSNRDPGLGKEVFIASVIQLPVGDCEGGCLGHTLRRILRNVRADRHMVGRSTRGWSPS